MMKIKNTLLLSLTVLGFILLLVPVSVHAETRYVSDVLVITMRTGAGDEYKIIDTLKTGTALEVLDESGNHLKVRTADGKEGWVLKQYLSAELPKKTVISRLKREVERLKSAAGKLERERAVINKSLAAEKNLRTRDVRGLDKSLKKKTGQVTELTRQLKDMTGKYDRLSKDSAEVVAVVEERDRLSEDNTRLGTENEVLTKKTERLRRRSAVYWFLAGGAVFLIGWLVGQVSKKRRSSYYTS